MSWQCCFLLEHDVLSPQAVDDIALSLTDPRLHSDNLHVNPELAISQASCVRQVRTEN